MMHALTGIVLLAAICGCAMHPVRVDQLSLNYPEPLVETKDATPVYIVATPENVRDHVTATGEGIKPTEIHGIRTFVTRDLRQALGHFYQSVTVISNESELPSTPHIVAEVRISNISTARDGSQVVTLAGKYVTNPTRGVMDWAIALRRSGEEKFFYNFSDRAVGSQATTTVSETSVMFGSTFEVAIDRLMKDLTKKNTDTATAQPTQQSSAGQDSPPAADAASAPPSTPPPVSAGGTKWSLTEVTAGFSAEAPGVAGTVRAEQGNHFVVIKGRFESQTGEPEVESEQIYVTYGQGGASATAKWTEIVPSPRGMSVVRKVEQGPLLVSFEANPIDLTLSFEIPAGVRCGISLSFGGTTAAATAPCE